MKIEILITEHQVATNEEMKILLIDGDIREFTPRNRRHQIFWKIKTSPYQTYKGPWGTEFIYWDGKTHGFVKSTELRSQEIRQHISDCLFG